MPQPKLLQTLWALGAIAKMRVPETPKGVVACLVVASHPVGEPQFLQGWVKVPAEDVGGAQWPSSAGLEQEPALPISGKFLESSGDLRVKIDFPKCACGLEPLFDLAMACLLLDADRQEVRGDVLVNLQAKRFPNPQASGTTQNEHHPLPFVLPGCQPRHDLG